jgi:uncharacterized protein (TIGR02145 family)
MKKTILIAIALVCTLNLKAQQAGTLTDSRDGKTYKITKIGDLTWMAENLNVVTFLNGDTIPEAKTDDAWSTAGEKGKPAWCYYNNKVKNGEKYGRIYNWYAVNDSRGLAPKGWHVSSLGDWGNLEIFLGRDGGSKLKSLTGWDEAGFGNNSTGFNALPGGSRGDDGAFETIKLCAYFWLSTDKEGVFGWDRTLQFNNEIINSSAPNKWCGFSVRCVKD